MSRKIYVAVSLFVLMFVTTFVFSQKPVQRRVINMPNRNIQAPFSDAVLIDDTLYLAGAIGVDPKTGKPPEKAEDEARLVMEGYKAILAEAGMTMDDIVSVQVYCTDLKLYDAFNSVYKTYFTKGYPARAFIGVASLLVGGRFEVQAIARKH
ncbi:MAG TPA: Rid family hydrolase [Acidobacteriota bacterium]